MEISYVNLTPHVINLNDGREFPPSGVVARVSTRYAPFNEDMITAVCFGEIENLPEPVDGVYYIVSGIVASATTRPDVVAPATNHPLTVRNEKGHVVSVPGFSR